MMKTHFFLAIPVLGQANVSLIEWKERNIQQFPFQKWVHPHDLHITLVFLGHVEEAMLRSLGDHIDEVIKSFPSFALTINELNTFGEKNRPRIFWSSVEKEERLYDLQKKVANACADLGIEIENRPYRPHITLARRWKGNDHYSSTQASQSFTQEYRSSWNVDKFHLYQSHIGKSPVYEPIRTFFL
ncbi:RNA 2',3'-cyclic phosphodiesterase [Alkalihalobacillus sp. BA299]|uniref:RNA 2',3'-cyclic phosphodiesterase n=1 Tax=Alkalihalobacillus sp. BA299 TaxID=2815938 RepID=UPI001ADA7E31|nr:RNA 2',3'-cyclic phosphodiesterase [Alkalihalobacillus sp. BA299]